MGMLDLGFLYLLLGVSFNQVGFRDGADGCGPRAMQRIANAVLCPGSRVCWFVGAVAGFVGVVTISQSW